MSAASPRPVGPAVPGWSPRPRPPHTAIEGRTCRVVPLDPIAHGGDLFEAEAEDPEATGWTYLPSERPAGRDAYFAWLGKMTAGDDRMFHAIVDRATGRACGMASYLRIDPANGTIEVGHIRYAPRLQRTAVATEAMFLMMRRVFDELGYRRYEWKCDSLNAASRAAALRLGFRFEGIFRQAVVYKARNRDTAWFSVIDAEWPALRPAFAAWLDAANFDAQGRQRRPLSAFMPVRADG
jgi:RimJ/RimL family protein N-acetyltransferase